MTDKLLPAKEHLIRELIEKYEKEYRGKWSPTLNDYLERGRILWEDEGFAEIPLTCRGKGYVPLLKFDHLKQIPAQTVVFIKDDFGHPLFSKRSLKVGKYRQNAVEARKANRVRGKWDGGISFSEHITHMIIDEQRYSSRFASVLINPCIVWGSAFSDQFTFIPLSSNNEIIVKSTESKPPISFKRNKNSSVSVQQQWVLKRKRDAGIPSWKTLAEKEIYRTLQKQSAARQISKRRKYVYDRQAQYPFFHHLLDELVPRKQLEYWVPPSATYAYFNRVEPKSRFFFHQANVNFFTTNFPVNVTWFQVHVSPDTLRHIAANVRNGWGIYKGHFQWLKSQGIIDTVPDQCFTQARKKPIKKTNKENSH